MKIVGPAAATHQHHCRTAAILRRSIVRNNIEFLHKVFCRLELQAVIQLLRIDDSVKLEICVRSRTTADRSFREPWGNISRARGGPTVSRIYRSHQRAHNRPRSQADQLSDVEAIQRKAG